MTTSGSVLIFTDRLRGPVIEDVAEACRSAAVRPVCWPGAEARVEPDGAALLVGGLRPGERRIPQPLLSIATSPRCEAPILLLCEEPLVRTSVALHEGRVILLEQPIARSRLYSAVRVLLTGEDAEGQAYASRGEPAAIKLRAQRSKLVWTADLAGDRALQPVVRRSAGGGVTAVLPFEAMEQEAIAAAFELLRVGGPDDEIARALDDRAGLVHLTDDSASWVVHWPSRAAPLWVSSPRRLPNLFAVHSAAAHRLVRLAAMPGDVAAAIVCTKERAASAAHLASGLTEGGPAFVDGLVDWMRGEPSEVAAFVAEVR